MNRILILVLAGGLLLVASTNADAYLWYRVPVDTIDPPVYEIHFAAQGYLGTEAGVYRGQGFDWEGVGQDYPPLGARAILYDEGAGTLYCGFTEGSGMCESDGLYKWHEDGHFWEPVWWCARPYFLVEHPLEAGRFYFGNHYGLFTSTDFSEWTEIGGASLPDSVRCIWFHPTDPASIMAGTERGLYRYTPAQGEWRRVDSVPSLPIHDIETGRSRVPPFEPVVFASAGNGSFSDGVFCSHDWGESWERILTIPEPTDLLQDWTADESPLVMFVGTGHDGILRLGSDGQLFGDLNAGLPSGFVHRLCYDPYIDTPAIYAGTENGLNLCFLLQESSVEEEVRLAAPAGVICEAGPNPWRSAITLRVRGVDAISGVRLRVYDALGREVWSCDRAGRAEGNWSVLWTGVDRAGRAVPPGVYFYRFEMPGQTVGGGIVRLE